MPPLRHLLHTALGASVVCAAPLTAQTTPAGPPAPVGPPAAPATPPPRPPAWNEYRGEHFTARLGLALLLDHNVLFQDDANVTQVGDADPGTEWRGERLVVSGQLFPKRARPWRYLVAANYNGLDAPQERGERFDFLDWNVEIPLAGKGGWITVGKQKEGVGHEYILPGTVAQFMERGSGVPMFVRQRNVGVRWSNSVRDGRLTWTTGVFNDWFTRGGSLALQTTQFTARTTSLVRDVSPRDYVHVGLGWRWTGGGESRALTYRAKPEANTAPRFVDTGPIDAADANLLTEELIVARGPALFIAEAMQNGVDARTTANPWLRYWHVGASWFLTGEQRRYNRQTGNTARVTPLRPLTRGPGGGYGAWEVGARYTRTDANARAVDGGDFGRTSLALSWYPAGSWRLETNYGFGRLYRDQQVGRAQFLQFRVQWELL